MSTPVRHSSHSAPLVATATLAAVLTAWWPPADLGPWLLVAWGVVVVVARPVGPLAACIAAAVLVRVPFLFAPPIWSDDVYRYVWEGRVWAGGFNPFAFSPAAVALTPLRDPNWALVNHKEVSSIYPPLAQGLFFALAPGGVLAWKIAMAACDISTATVLYRHRAFAGWLWALLPLPALESAGSGHLEGIGILFTALALRGSVSAAWAGAMVKLLPAVLFLRSARPGEWVLATAATAVVFLPVFDPDMLTGFETYRATWAYNGSAYPLAIALLPEPTARLALQGVGAIVVLAILARSRDPGRIALWTFGAFVILSPTVHPWYVLWPLLAALWNGSRAWLVLAVTVPLSYVVLSTYDGSAWREPAWPRWVVYPPFFVALAWESWRRWTRPGPAPAH